MSAPKRFRGSAYVRYTCPFVRLAYECGEAGCCSRMWRTQAVTRVRLGTPHPPRWNMRRREPVTGDRLGTPHPRRSPLAGTSRTMDAHRGTHTARQRCRGSASQRCTLSGNVQRTAALPRKRSTGLLTPPTNAAASRSPPTCTPQASTPSCPKPWRPPPWTASCTTPTSCSPRAPPTGWPKPPPATESPADLTPQPDQPTASHDIPRPPTGRSDVRQHGHQPAAHREVPMALDSSCRSPAQTELRWRTPPLTGTSEVWLLHRVGAKRSDAGPTPSWSANRTVIWLSNRAGTSVGRMARATGGSGRRVGGVGAGSSLLSRDSIDGHEQPGRTVLVAVYVLVVDGLVGQFAIVVGSAVHTMSSLSSPPGMTRILSDLHSRSSSGSFREKSTVASTISSSATTTMRG